MYSNLERYVADRKPPIGAVLNPYLSINRGLVLDTMMWEGAGDTVEDLSGNELSGILGNGALWGEAPYGAAVNVDANDANINYGTDSIFDFTTEDFSIVLVWGSSTDPGFNKQIVGRSINNLKGWRLEVDWPINQLSFKTHTGGGFVETTSNNVLVYDGRMYHIVVTRSGTVVKIYINGVDETDVAGIHLDPVSWAATNMYLGRASGAGADVPGKFAQYIVYNRAISASEYALLYLEPFCGFRWTSIEQLAAYIAVAPPEIKALFMDLSTQIWTIKHSQGIFTKL